MKDETFGDYNSTCPLIPQHFRVSILLSEREGDQLKAVLFFAPETGVEQSLLFEPRAHASFFFHYYHTHTPGVGNKASGCCAI